MIKVGQISENRQSNFAEIVARPSLMSPRDSQQFRCRVWTLNALEALTDAGVIQCTNVDEFEAEANTVADSHAVQKARTGEVIVMESSYSC